MCVPEHSSEWILANRSMSPAMLRQGVTLASSQLPGDRVSRTWMSKSQEGAYLVASLECHELSLTLAHGCEVVVQHDAFAICGGLRTFHEPRLKIARGGRTSLEHPA